jgi:hypothetical protein
MGDAVSADGTEARRHGRGGARWRWRWRNADGARLVTHAAVRLEERCPTVVAVVAVVVAIACVLEASCAGQGNKTTLGRASGGKAAASSGSRKVKVN